jgi:hypothetical protein
MRTTIRIDESVYRRAKAQAAESGRTVSEVIEDAVREALAPRLDDTVALRPLPVFTGSGLQPGVDLSCNAALLDLMDEGVPLDALR